jgi:hypothetical protein
VQKIDSMSLNSLSKQQENLGWKQNWRNYRSPRHRLGVMGFRVQMQWTMLRNWQLAGGNAPANICINVLNQ